MRGNASSMKVSDFNAESWTHTRVHSSLGRRRRRRKTGWWLVARLYSALLADDKDDDGASRVDVCGKGSAIFVRLRSKLVCKCGINKIRTFAVTTNSRNSIKVSYSLSPDRQSSLRSSLGNIYHMNRINLQLSCTKNNPFLCDCESGK